jgi:DNA mismatch endonuclease (patch repair protein)
MQANRRRDTRPELLLRSALHSRGLRFRVDFPLVAEGVRTRPDIVFPRARVAVFVDGCFWHGCPEHSRVPRSNSAYWAPKLAANISRDKRANKALAEAGWAVLRIWEHEAAPTAADRVEMLVRPAATRSKPQDISPSPGH